MLSAEEDGSDLRTEAEVPAQPSGLGWLPDGRMLVVSMRDAGCSAARPTARWSTHADLGEHVGGYPNDMVVDAQGRAYVGNFGFDLMGGAPVATAALLRVDPDGGVTAVAQDMWFANGSVITDDGVLIVDETFGNRVSAFDIAADGALANRRTWAKFAELPTDDATCTRRWASSSSPRTAAAWTPRARCGSPTPSARGSCACGKAGRSSTRSVSAPACTPACSAAVTVAPCTPARRPTSTRRPAPPPARGA